MSVKLPVQPNCAKQLICVSTTDSETCPGAGSVLKCDKEVAGIGLKCNEENNEMVFVDVSKYNKWIDQVFRDVVHDNGKVDDSAEKSSKEVENSSEEEAESIDEYAGTFYKLLKY